MKRIGELVFVVLLCASVFFQIHSDGSAYVNSGDSTSFSHEDKLEILNSIADDYGYSGEVDNYYYKISQQKPKEKHDEGVWDKSNVWNEFSFRFDYENIEGSVDDKLEQIVDNDTVYEDHEIVNIGGYDVAVLKTIYEGNAIDHRFSSEYHACGPSSKGSYDYVKISMYAYIPQGPTSSDFLRVYLNLVKYNSSGALTGEKVGSAKEYYVHCFEDQEQKATSIMSDAIRQLKPFVTDISDDIEEENDEQVVPPVEVPESTLEMVVNFDKKQINADGEEKINFSVEIGKGDESFDGDAVDVSIVPEDKSWEGRIGGPDPGDGQFDSKNQFNFEYQPPELLQGPGAHEPLIIHVQVRHKKSGTSVLRKVLLNPSPINIGIKYMDALQALKGQPLVAGKKMVLFVGVKSDNLDLINDPDAPLQGKLRIEFDGGGSFAPKSNFEDISLSGPSNDDNVVRIVDDSGLTEHLMFFGKEPDFSTGDNWVFFQVYVDPEDASYSGKYTINSTLYLERTDPENGKVRTEKIDSLTKEYPVYSSGFMSVKVMPLALGLWDEDFCQYCLEEDGFMSKAGSSNKRLFSKYVERGDGYDFTCDSNLFGRTFTADVNKNLINKYLHLEVDPTSDGFSEFRDACQKGFEDIFLQPISKMGGKTPFEVMLAKNVSAVDARGDAKSFGQPSDEKYEQIVEDSKEYMRAVLPLAEENVFFSVEKKPYSVPGLDVKTSWPSSVLRAFSDMKAGRVYSRSVLSNLTPAQWSERWGYESSGLPQFEGFTRIVAYVPPSSTGSSNLSLFEEGYSNTLWNPWVVLVNNNSADEEVMAHEVFHTYCAVDEAIVDQVKGHVATPFICGEGGLAINNYAGFDIRGRKITNGFWVEKRQFYGTPFSPKYSLMGGDEFNSRWVTDDLYHGVGVKLGVFPTVVDKIIMQVFDD